MKKKFCLFLFLILFIRLVAMADIYADSIWRISDSLSDIRTHDTTTDIGLLRAYEDLTIHLLKAGGEYYDTCRKLCEEAAAYAYSLDNIVFESAFNVRIGETYFYTGDYGKTSYYWTKALEIAEAGNDIKMTAQALNNLGVLNQTIEMYEESLEYYGRSMELKKQRGDTTLSLPLTKLNMAVALIFLNRTDSAKAVLDQIREQILASDFHAAKVYYYNNMGSVYTAKKDYPKALEAYLKADSLREYIGTTYRITISQNIGEAYFLLGQTEKGFRYLNESLKKARENNYLFAIKSIHRILANHYAKVGDFEMAYENNKLYTKFKDSLFNIDKNREIRTMQAIYELERKEQENALLAEKVINEELRADRHMKINRFLITSILLAILGVLVIAYFWRKSHNLNLQLMQKKEQLEHLNRELTLAKEETEKALEFKSQFLANISHEVRTPLNIIIGFNSILKKHITDAKLKKYIRSIEVSSYNLLQFLNDILDMSKIEAGRMQLKPEHINLKSMIYDLGEVFNLKAQEKDLTLELEIDRYLPSCFYIDEVRLRQILVNLIGNAIKFTERGFVKIIVQTDHDSKPACRFSSSANLIIKVQDTGIGIDAAHQNEVFESFRQVNQQNRTEMGGSGLGLSISKRLTEMMNGELTLESQPGTGSTFTLRFRNIPVSNIIKDEQSQTENLHEFSNIEFGKCTILIADDEEMNRSLIRASFENSQILVEEAENGREAVEIAMQVRPDLILMDLKMPFMDGFEASAALKKNSETTHIPIFAFTASNFYSDFTDEQKELFAAFIAKPVYMYELLEEMAKYLPHRITGKPEVTDRDDRALEQMIAEDRQNVDVSARNFLNDNMMKIWSEVYGSNSMNRIRDFAGQLSEVAEKEQLKSLILCAGELRNAVNTFDIDKAKAVLKRYPEIIHALTTNSIKKE
ncbi:MAG: ATP-binding protein [Bacteroidales bacterium]